MSRRRDPVQRRDDGDVELHDVVEWEPRTVVDRAVFVIYSAFAGYYLGLARFNRRYAGPVVLKGLAIAVSLHALYNVLVSTEALHAPGYRATRDDDPIGSELTEFERDVE